MRQPNPNPRAKNILVVDDDESIRQVICDILELEGYNCLVSSSVSEAKTCLDENPFDLILSDINMPGESGIELVRYVFDKYPDIATIMVTGVVDHNLAEAVFELGVYDYITKPVSRSGVLISVKNALHRRELEISNRTYREGLEKMVADRTTSLRSIMQQLRETIDGVIQTIALTVEIRDPYTAGHQRRVATLARAIAIEMGFPGESIEGIYHAGVIHDLGKISVPAEILSKPGRLTVNELNLIKDHPQTGFDILKDIKFPWPIAQVVLQHHERHDGSGYPQGLTGSRMLPEARIIAVADVVEAIASHRPYRPALGIDFALEEISRDKGIAYDPDVTEVCLKLFSEKGFQF